jgi:hypothetical protein
LQYELLFCIEDDSDSAIMIVNSLMEKYPKVNAHLFVGKGFIFISVTTVLSAFLVCTPADVADAAGFGGYAMSASI